MKDRDIFIAALEKDPAERPAYLDRACGTDHALRQHIEGLFQVCEKAGNFLESPAAGMDVMLDQRVTEGPGTVIGPYKLLEQIGEGGFGIVFMAEQQQPVRRKVAIKVVKPGMDTRQVIARFEAERQALALMDHPNIAHVLEAGTTDSARPYFVMELVRGVAMTQFCDDNQLTLSERLKLFVVVCQAVQHAHQKGIIHRDLKPSNVLVTLDDGTPLVKVIDFGIAKALGQERLTDKTLFTGFSQMLGTPLYMSPEQTEMSRQEADTRTDIYSLGVLLYELLTGTTPFDKERLKEASFDEIRRIIREEEPAKPSTRISTLGQAATTASANRKSEPKRLSQLFRGELDWIVMKALEKDRNRRYESAGSFAADVERYLHDEPVLACPPSAVYRFRKFARRNKATLMTASGIGFAVLLAVTGLAISTLLVWRVNNQLGDSLEREHRSNNELSNSLGRERQNLYYHRIALAEREWSANNLGRVEQLLDACPDDLRGWEWHYLKRLRLKSIPPLRHSAAVLSAAFSPDGRWIASGSRDGKVTVWDATTGQELFAFPAHEWQIWSVAFSPDGRLLATASWDKTVKVWRFNPLLGVRMLPLLHTLIHADRVHSVAFGPDSQRLASAGDDKIVRVWDMAMGREVFPPLRGHARHIWCVAYSPDGQCLASASEDTTVRIWDAATGVEMRTFGSHTQPVFCVAFSGNGKQLASGTTDFYAMADGDLKVWDAQTGREILSLRGHVGWISSVAFSPDGRRLVSAGMDGNAKLWDLATGQEVLTLRGHSGLVRSVVFSSDGNQILSAGNDGTVRVWNGKPLEGDARQEVFTLRGHEGGVRSVAFSADGGRLASAGDDATVRIWDFQRGLAGDPNPLIQALSGGKAISLNVAFSKDGQLLASGNGGGRLGGRLMVWDTTTYKEITLPNVGPPVAFSPDGQYLAAVSPDFTIDIWEVREQAIGRKIHALKGHSFAIQAIVFGPDLGFARLASASVDATVRIWDVATGQSTVSLPHRQGIRAVAFSSDGRRLASGSGDRTVRVWDAKTGELLDTLPDPTGGVRSVAFHPKHDRVLAWGSTDSTVKVWNSATKEIRTLHGHTKWVESVAFSPDGEWIASASLDGTVKLWPMPTLPEVRAAAAEAPDLEVGGKNN